MVTAETYPTNEMFYSCQKSISRKNPVLPIEKFPSLLLPGNVTMLQHLIQLSLYYQSSGRLWEVKQKKTKENLKLLALKVVVFAYKRFQV